MTSRVVPAVLLALASCASDPTPEIGDTSFVSAPPTGAGPRGGTTAEGDGSSGGPPATPGTGTSQTPRAVEETDIYRLDGDRLYFLNAYRGLMVFDVSDVDHPRLLGRSPIYGWPVQMVVRDGIAVVVVADWYGALDDGTPFHGSIVRGLDARDPADIHPVGEAKLGGWVSDTRVVGDVLYAVSVDYGWIYGVADGVGVAVPAGDTAGTTAGPNLLVSSVSFAGGQIRHVDAIEHDGWSGVFHVTADAILLAHTTAFSEAPARTELEYLDISDPGGTIVPRGAITVDGAVQGWGADAGRWNLDFADGEHAHVVGCAGPFWCGGGGGYVVSAVDFTDPDAPALQSDLDIPAPGWSVAARFIGDRLYLAADGWSGHPSTPFVVVDLSNPEALRVAGSTQLPGTVWNLLPGLEDTLFALGNDWGTDSSGSSVTLSHVDVADATQPQVLGTARFGEGWAWTPAAGTFKAFTMDAARGLVVLPFSGWSSTTASYTNGLQLIEFTDSSIRTAGAAHTRGWVERGIFVRDRLVALSDVSLSVVDFAQHAAPRVTAEMTLARNVVAARPFGDRIAQVSTDFWGYDTSTSEIRVLPIADAEERGDVGHVPQLSVPGTNARVFENGDLSYVVTDVYSLGPCPASTGDPSARCNRRSQRVQVVDLSGGGARPRGAIDLPPDLGGWGWGWYGCFPWDWYGGSEMVQVGDSALAFRRWQPIWDVAGIRLDDNSKLYVVNLADPDAPSLASATITQDPNGWWGNMRVVGDTLYATHYEWVAPAGDGQAGQVRYYADRIDLSDPSRPRVEAKINVPGMLVGGSASDPSILYFIDYRTEGDRGWNELDVARVHGSSATLIGRLRFDGWVGGTLVRGDRAYLTEQRWADNRTTLRLHAIDLGEPHRPVDRVASERAGWGWLLDVQGDRALVTSGWGLSGLDIYRLREDKAPTFERFVRTLGWWTNAVARQGDSLFLASGSWGVQRIDLE